MSDKFDEIVKERIDSIAPEDGAGERMLENIKRKAADSEIKSENSKVIPWKKIIKIATPLAACIAVVIIIGINGNRDTGKMRSTSREPQDKMVYSAGMCTSTGPAESSAEEVKESLGINFTIPDGAYGVQYYMVSETEAFVTFSYNGHEYKIGADKSGTEDIKSDAEDELLYEVKWTEGEVVYTLINEDCADKAEFDEVYAKTKSIEN